MNTVTIFGDVSESRKYYLDLNYMPTPWFACYIKEDEERVEGWKTHVVIENDKDYLFMTENLLPLLREHDIQHKVVYHAKYQEFNSFEDTQVGKIVTIYDSNLSFLTHCSEELLDFLRQETAIQIPSDKGIGGRVFVRYTGFSDDKVLNPDTNELEYLPREEGVYKPVWIREPKMLTEHLQKQEDEVSSLRGGILEQAEKTGLPKRFMVKDIEDRPAMLIIDQVTGRKSEVSLFAYGSVRQTLRDLFNEEE